MLNNDFKQLTEKYTRYQKQKRMSLYLKVIFFLALVGLAFYVSTLDFTKPKTIIETNTSSITVEEKEENTTLKADTDKEEINKHRLQVITGEKSLEQLMANQEKSKSYSSTISIANYHYSKKSYDDAVKWSIVASKLNKEKVRPWIVYAKSKLAIGKVDIAKKALGAYLKKHDSKEAQELLDKLNSI